MKSQKLSLDSPTELFLHKDTAGAFIYVKTFFFLLGAGNRGQVVDSKPTKIAGQIEFGDKWHASVRSHHHLLALRRLGFDTVNLHSAMSLPWY